MIEGWKPIETAPKDGTEILLYELGDGMYSGCWHKKTDEWAACWIPTMIDVEYMDTDYFPSCWMELPEVPEKI